MAAEVRGESGLPGSPTFSSSPRPWFRQCVKMPSSTLLNMYVSLSSSTTAHYFPCFFHHPLHGVKQSKKAKCISRFALSDDLMDVTDTTMGAYTSFEVFDAHPGTCTVW